MILMDNKEVKDKIADADTRIVDLADIHPADYNPREDLQPGNPDYDALKRSIQENGYVGLILINKDGTIIGGHQRYKVLKDLGYTKARVLVTDVDKPTEKALNIALNKISGDWDEVKLKEALMDLDLNDYDLTKTGFSSSEVEDLVIKLDKDVEAEDDDFDEEKALAEVEEPTTQRGDIWILGEHRLMCGDSTDFSDVSTLMQGEEADLIITDPPYNVDYEEKDASLAYSFKKNTQRKSTKIINDKMSDSQFYDFLLSVFNNCYEAARPGAAVYVFHADSEGLRFRSAFDEAGFKLAQIIIWEKNNFVLGRQDYQWRHEPILYGWKEGAAHYFIDDRSQDTVLLEDELDFSSMKKEDLITYINQIRESYKDKTTVIYEKKPQSSKLHPTMKPISLIGRLMKNSSKPDWNVLDLFGGSGSTLMAAEQLGRRAYLMELDETYCDVIIKRWEDFTGQKARKQKPLEVSL